jgi:ATP-dependent protease HslVU (ClpYQ) peptidase subunit
MTCIVALRCPRDNTVYIGGDSQGTGGHSKSNRLDKKVFRLNNGMKIGFTTSYRMGQILKYKLNLPSFIQEDIDLEQYMCTTFIDSVKRVLADNGAQYEENGVVSGGTFIVAYKDRLFVIYDDFQVAEPEEPYASVGSGSDLALGCLKAFESFGILSGSGYITPNDNVHSFITRAINVAASFNSTVGGRVHIV